MKVKVIQADTRKMFLYLESKPLVYTPINDINFQLVSEYNDGLIFPNDGNSLCMSVNMVKSKMLGFLYEFIQGNPNDWQEEGKKSHTWIKIKSLLEQFADPKLTDYDLFLFIDSDAWIRDEEALLNFCTEFLNSSCHLAVPRDIELYNSSYFNSGFIAVKNTSAGKHILETIYSHPDYRTHDMAIWHEQSELDTYHTNHPGEILVLPLNDFNTPCGRIVRHCWIKHMVEPFILQEIVALFSKIAIQSLSN